MARDWIAYAPSSDLMAESVRVTERMKRLALPEATRTPVKRMTPGRLNTRAAVQAAGLRANGQRDAALKVAQFRGHHIDRTKRPPGVVGIMSDVSGSMKWSTTGVGEAAWLLARGAAHSGARVASVVFGEGVDPIVFPGEVPQTVLVRSANDGQHNPDRALAALDGALGLSIPTTAGVPTSRIVVILSDLQWGAERMPFIARARALMAAGVRFIVLGTHLGFTGPDHRIGTGDRIEPDIVAALGTHTPVDPRALDPDSPQHQALPAAVQAAIRQNGVHAFAERQPAPLTGAEVYAARAAGVKRLPPMTVIPRLLLGSSGPDYGQHYLGRMDPTQVRQGIVEHTLRALEGME